MEQIKVSVVGTNVSGEECIYSTVQAQGYQPDKLEPMIDQAITEAVQAVHGFDEKDLQVFQPQVTVWSVSDGVRPSFHLSAPLLERLARARASLDFDPYA